MSKTLKVQKREIVGNEARKLRREGVLPAVVYGKGFDPINIQLEGKEFIRVYRSMKDGEKIVLESDKDKYEVTIQDIDLHPVKQLVRHIDFLIAN
jgi:large subunit ribosomal protein L25